MGFVSQVRQSSLGQLLEQSVEELIDLQPFQLAAALSYYSLLSLAPLLLIVTGATGLIVDEAVIREALIEQTDRLVGAEGGAFLRNVIQNLDASDSNVWSIVVGILLSFVGATTVFAQLHTALNSVWHVEVKPEDAVAGFVRARVISLAIVMGLGFLLLVSLIVSATLSNLSSSIGEWIPDITPLWRLVDLSVSVMIYTLLLALLFRYVPDARVAWRDSLVGGFITASLFTAGKYAIGVYLGEASVGSTYGAAGSAVVFMVWVYYASLILFYGAVLTRLTARRARRDPVLPEFAEHE